MNGRCDVTLIPVVEAVEDGEHILLELLRRPDRYVSLNFGDVQMESANRASNSLAENESLLSNWSELIADGLSRLFGATGSRGGEKLGNAPDDYSVTDTMQAGKLRRWFDKRNGDELQEG